MNWMFVCQSKMCPRTSSFDYKTNPEPDKLLALKSRGVVEFTADEGLVTRNKSSSPFFR